MNNTEKLLEEKELTKIEKLFVKNGEQEYVDKLHQMSRKELEMELLSLATHAQAIVTTKKNDEELRLASEKRRELNAPYAEQMKFNKSRARLTALILEEVGK